MYSSKSSYKERAVSAGNNIVMCVLQPAAEIPVEAQGWAEQLRLRRERDLRILHVISQSVRERKEAAVGRCSLGLSFPIILFPFACRHVCARTCSCKRANMCMLHV